MSKKIKNRIEGLLVFDCENGNPNGDPDGGNLPRLNPLTSHGWVTDVCLKRRIRDHVGNFYNGNGKNNIHVANQTDLNVNIFKAYEETGGLPQNDKKGKKEELEKWDRFRASEATEWLCQHFFDIRAFGAVLNTGPKSKNVMGPVQLTMAESIDPIFPMDIGITRVARAGLTDKEEKQKLNPQSSEECKAIADARGPNENQTMGRKQLIPYGLFVGKFFINPFLAEKTGFDEDDLKVLFDSMLQMFDINRSASKGYMTTRKLIIFKHIGTNAGTSGYEQECMLGCAPSHELLELGNIVSIDKKNNIEQPSKFKDYSITINKDAIPSGVEINVLR